MRIIIPAYGNLDITSRAFFGCLLNGPPAARITVVDNGSPDDCLAPLKPIVESHGHDWIRIDPNIGPYGAVNEAIEASTDDVIAVVCNDVVPLPYSLAYLEDCIHSVDVAAAVELQTSPFNTDVLLDEVNDKGLRDSACMRRGVFFSCFVTTRSVYDKVGLFDDRFKLTFGDTDWEQRVSDAGLVYEVAEHAPVYHGSSVTRKRLGIDADMQVDVSDHLSFLAKWKHRPDVVANHPLEDKAFKRRFVENEWSYRGEK